MNEEMGRIIGASMARGKDAWLKWKLDSINEACQEILFERDGGDTEGN